MDINSYTIRVLSILCVFSVQLGAARQHPLEALRLLKAGFITLCYLFKAVPSVLIQSFIYGILQNIKRFTRSKQNNYIYLNTGYNACFHEADHQIKNVVLKGVILVYFLWYNDRLGPWPVNLQNPEVSFYHVLVSPPTPHKLDYILGTRFSGNRLNDRRS